MCEADAYLIKGETQELVMKAVDIVEPEENGLRLISIFGDQKFLNAAIHSLSLVDHKIILKNLD
jgi:predicted RNA-binding protein